MTENNKLESLLCDNPKTSEKHDEMMKSIKLDIRTGTPLNMTKMKYISELSKCEMYRLICIFNYCSGE